MPINFLNEIIFASDKPTEAKMIAYKESKGDLRKIAPRLYTTNLVDSPENIVKRNLISILGGVRRKCGRRAALFPADPPSLRKKQVEVGTCPSIQG